MAQFQQPEFPGPNYTPPRGWTPEEIIWVRSRWQMICEHQSKATRESRQWNRLNAALKERYSSLTAIDRDRRIADNEQLKDYFGAHKWHAAESQRLIDHVQLFIKMKETGLL